MHEMTIRITEAYGLLVNYCMNETFLFCVEDLAQGLAKSCRFLDGAGDDPIWG